MSTHRLGSALSASLLLAFFLLPLAGLAGQGLDREAGREATLQRLGVVVCQQDNCITFNGRFRGPFFENFEAKGTPDAPMFLSNGSRVKSFPEQVVAHIDARGKPIFSPYSLIENDPAGGKSDDKNTKAPPAPAVEPQRTEVPLTRETMSNLWFKAAWKHNDELRPVEDLMWDMDTPRWRQTSGPQWYYNLNFTAKEVPLTDTLVVTILADSGEQLATLEVQAPRPR